jgi:hypothetical protein
LNGDEEDKWDADITEKGTGMEMGKRNENENENGNMNWNGIVTWRRKRES